MSTRVERRNLVTLAALVGIVGGMGGVVYQSASLYRLFCQVTGFGGTTRVADAAPARVLDRVITVRFNADVNSALPWRFAPARRKVRVRLGERTLAYYRAENTSSGAVTGTATFNVTPAKAGPYFNKLECFCFTEQTLAPGQSADMPVSFFVDPDMAGDRNLDDITTITLSYTFFKAKTKEDGPSARSAPAIRSAATASAASVN